MRSWTAALVGMAVALATAGALAAEQPAPGPIIDNERVTVWEMVMSADQALPAPAGGLDEAIMFLSDGALRAVGAVAAHKAGEVVFIPRGTQALAEPMTGAPVHVVVIALKDVASAPVAPVGDLPTAFPRKGAVKVFENDRVVAWKYAWPPGVATPMHYHDKDVVIAYRTAGSVESVTADGKGVVNVYKAGEVRFNPSRRVHFERWIAGMPSAVIVELKPRT